MMDSGSKGAVESQRLSADQALTLFADEGTPMPQRRAALSVLIGEKFLPKQADDPRVSAGRGEPARRRQTISGRGWP